MRYEANDRALDPRYAAYRQVNGTAITPPDGNARPAISGTRLLRAKAYHGCHGCHGCHR